MSGFSISTYNHIAQNNNMSLAYAGSCGAVRDTLDVPVELVRAAGGAVSTAYNITDRAVKYLTGDYFNLQTGFQTVSTVHFQKNNLQNLVINGCACAVILSAAAQFVMQRLADGPAQAIGDAAIVARHVAYQGVVKASSLALRILQLPVDAFWLTMSLPGHALGVITSLPQWTWSSAKGLANIVANYRTAQVIIAYSALEKGYQSKCENYEDAYMARPDAKMRAVDRIHKMKIKSEIDTTKHNLIQQLKVEQDENLVEMGKVLDELNGFGRMSEETPERQKLIQTLLDKKTGLNQRYNYLSDQIKGLEQLS